MIESMVLSEIFRDRNGKPIKVKVIFFDEKGIEVSTMSLSANKLKVAELKQGIELEFIERIKPIAQG